VWKQCVNADAGLLRLDGVDVVFGFAALFGDGQEAQRGDGLEGIGSCWMPHTETNRREVVNVNDGDNRNERDENPLHDRTDGRQRAIPLSGEQAR
jgi:hypothetical protein